MGRKKKIPKQNSDDIILSAPKKIKNSEIIDKQTKDLFVENYGIYSSYIASGRTTCYIMDGMKSVYRRVLYSAFRNCRRENVKSVSLDGRTLAAYHPHGSCYGTIVGMVEDGFLIGKGNWGSHVGVVEISPAAPRYTEVRLNPISEVLFINPDLLPYVDWRLSDLGYNEPEFLPALVPLIMTALNDTSMMDVGTGIHLKNQYPKFSVDSILDYIIHYLKTGKFNKKLLTFKFMNLTKPFGENENYDDSSHKFIETFKIKFNTSNDGTYLTSTLPDFNMESKLSGIPYKDFSKDSTMIFIPQKYFNENLFVSKVHFSSFAYSGNEDNVIIHPYSIRTAVLRILRNFKEIIVPRYYETEITKLKNLIYELEILVSIADKLSKSKKFTEIYDTLNDDEKRIADKYTVKAMLKIKLSDIDEIKTRLNILEKESKNVDKFILKLYENARVEVKKYLKAD